MFWERITIEGFAAVTVEKDLVKGTVKWSVNVANLITTGEAETVAEAFKAAIAVAEGQERKIREDAMKEFGLADLLDQ